MLLAWAPTLPLLLAAAGCRSADAFAGPDPLAGPPRLAHDVVTLHAGIAAEQNLIHLYRTAIHRHSGATARAPPLQPLLAQPEQAPAQPRARLVPPPGAPGAPGA